MGGADIVLRGMTWSHPRGIDPLIACAEIWRARTGVDVHWDARSLQDFESYPLEELANRYDLIVVDHPHVGQIAEEGCLLRLDDERRRGDLEALKLNSVGPSFASYEWAGHMWALPLDAAAQVLAYNPCKLQSAPKHWRDVLALAKEGKVRCPMRPPHSLMSFFTLCGLIGQSCRADGDELIERAAGARAVEMLRELVSYLDPADLESDPIAVLEDMARADGAIECAPLIYGYVNYAKAGFRPTRIAFADLPAVSGEIRGSTLGGTGVAVSRFCQFPDEATKHAFWLASAAVQSGPYVSSGGQPAHSAAWDADDVNAAALNFYRATRATLESAWVRPRRNGYMRFQQEASELLNQAIAAQTAPSRIVDSLNTLYRETLGL